MLRSPQQYQPISAFPAQYIGCYFAQRLSNNRFDLSYKQIAQSWVLFFFLKHFASFKETPYVPQTRILSESQLIDLIDYHQSEEFVRYTIRKGITYDMAVRYAGQFDGHMLRFIKPNLVDQALVDLYFSISPDTVLYAPPKFITEAMLDKAVSAHPLIYTSLKPPFQLQKYALLYLQSAGSQIYNVNSEDLTPDLIKVSLSTSTENYTYIPEHLNTLEIKEFLLTLNRPNTLYLIREADREALNPSITRRYLSHHLDEIVHFPISHINNELATLLLDHDPLNIEYIPEALLDDRIVQRAIDINPQAVLNIPESFLTEDRMYSGVTYNSNFLQHYPKQKLTQKICDQAFFTGIVSIQYVPSQYQTFEMATIHLDRGESPNHISDEIMTDELYFHASMCAPKNFSKMPEHLQTLEFLLKCFKRYNYVYQDDWPLHLIQQIPSMLVHCKASNWPTATRLDELFQIWVQDDTITDEQLSNLLEKAPARLKKIKHWVKWSIIYL